MFTLVGAFTLLCRNFIEASSLLRRRLQLLLVDPLRIFVRVMVNSLLAALVVPGADSFLFGIGSHVVFPILRIGGYECFRWRHFLGVRGLLVHAWANIRISAELAYLENFFAIQGLLSLSLVRTALYLVGRRHGHHMRSARVLSLKFTIASFL